MKSCDFVIPTEGLPKAGPIGCAQGGPRGGIWPRMGGTRGLWPDPFGRLRAGSSIPMCIGTRDDNQKCARAIANNQ